MVIMYNYIVLIIDPHCANSISFTGGSYKFSITTLFAQKKMKIKSKYIAELKKKKWHECDICTFVCIGLNGAWL